MYKVLIVDDEEVIRDLIEDSLAKEGYELAKANNGMEAMEKVNSFGPDLIVLDLMMPDKWGYAVCEEVKGNPETSRIAVLFLTARDSLPSKKMGEMKGGDGYMLKPFRPEELRARIRELLESRDS